MRFGISGIGLWGEGIQSWREFHTGLTQGFTHSSGPKPPAPASMPARERRRSPLVVKLAMEVINQACRMANVDEAEVCSVFSSAMGDNHITDAICRTLADENDILSPTLFHNSVHNVTSGYWCIATENRQPSTFVSCFKHSFSLALVETVATALSEQKTTVLAIYDTAFAMPLFDICPIREDFAAGFVIDPDTDSATWTFEISMRPEGATYQSKNTYIAERIKNNPAALALSLCELISEEQSSICLPMGFADDQHQALTIRLC